MKKILISLVLFSSGLISLAARPMLRYDLDLWLKGRKIYFQNTVKNDIISKLDALDKLGYFTNEQKTMPEADAIFSNIKGIFYSELKRSNKLISIGKLYKIIEAEMLSSGQKLLPSCLKTCSRYENCFSNKIKKEILDGILMWISHCVIGQQSPESIPPHVRLMGFLTAAKLAVIKEVKVLSCACPMSTCDEDSFMYVSKRGIDLQIPVDAIVENIRNIENISKGQLEEFVKEVRVQYTELPEFDQETLDLFSNFYTQYPKRLQPENREPEQKRRRTCVEEQGA